MHRLLRWLALSRPASLFAELGIKLKAYQGRLILD
jgi:hypothetical protein